MADKYDEAIEYFKENPDKIRRAWGSPEKHPYGYLFGYVSSNRLDSQGDIGCPVMIRHWYDFKALDNDELTERLMYDPLIPTPEKLGVEHLEYLAQLQREFDVIYGRT